MYQWLDDTLVAIKTLDNGKFKVVELPARQTESITSRRSFNTEEKAEAYIADQYPTTALTVPYEDIEEEIERRQTILPVNEM